MVQRALNRPEIAPLRNAAGHAISRILGRKYEWPLENKQPSVPDEQLVKLQAALERDRVSWIPLMTTQLKTGLQGSWTFVKYINTTARSYAGVKQEEARALRVERENAAKRLKALQATESALRKQSEIQRRALEQLNAEVGGLKAANSRLKSSLAERSQQNQQQHQQQTPREAGSEDEPDIEADDASDAPVPAVAAAALGLLGLSAAVPLGFVVRRTRKRQKAVHASPQQQVNYLMLGG